MKFLTRVDNSQLEGTVSQIFDIGPSFYFIFLIHEKKRNRKCVTIR